MDEFEESQLGGASSHLDDLVSLISDNAGFVAGHPGHLTMLDQIIRKNAKPGNEPPPSLILGAYQFTTVEEHLARIKEQLEWAIENRCFPQVEEFFRDLIDGNEPT